MTSSRLPSRACAGPRTRRQWLLRQMGAATAMATSGLLLSQPARSRNTPPLVLSWTGTGLCLSPILVARELDYFQRQGVTIDIINFAGAVDQVLESIATGKADLSLGLIHAWLKPLESGFDVKVVGSAHAGCIRVLAPREQNIQTIEQVKGKTIAVSSPAGFGRQFFSTALARRGINPESEVNWRAFPADQLDLAINKGEAHVIADADPTLFLIEKRNPGRYLEIANVQKGDFENRLCCIIVTRTALLSERRDEVAAAVRALHQAALFIADNPGEAARLVHPYLPRASVDELRTILSGFSYRHHTRGIPLKDEIAAYARDLQQVGVLKRSTDPERLAQHLAHDVLA